MMHDQRLKSIDRTFGTAICWLLARWCYLKKRLKPSHSQSLQSFNKPKILVIKLCCLGDAILLVPSLRNLRRNFPDSSITVLTTHRTSGLFHSVSYVDSVVELPLSIQPLTLFSVISQLSRQGFDLVFTFDPWYRIATLLASFLRPRLNAGFFYRGLKFISSIFTFSKEYTEDRHVVQTYLDLLRAAGLDVVDSHLEFFLDQASEQFAMEFFAKNRLSFPVISIFPGSSARWTLKRWPIRNYAQLADKLIHDFSANILLLSGKGQDDLTHAIKANMQGNATIVPGDTDVLQLASLLSKCDLVVVGDTAPMHIAAAVGTPVVAIFSNVPHVAYHPWMEPDKYAVVRKDIPCSPCVVFGDMPPCPFQYKCIQEVSVDEVIMAVRQIWLQTGVTKGSKSAQENKRR